MKLRYGTHLSLSAASKTRRGPLCRQNMSRRKDCSKSGLHATLFIPKTEPNRDRSGLTYTSIREGAYAEAFPLFLDWQLERTKLILPADGEVAFTLRADLGEATARIMIRGGYENQIVLMTAGETITAREIVGVINETTGRQIKLEIVSREEYIRRSSTEDARGKPTQHFEMVATIWDDIADGALSTTHPLMREILGREPTKPRDALRLLLAEDRDYVYP